MNNSEINQPPEVQEERKYVDLMQLYGIKESARQHGDTYRPSQEISQSNRPYYQETDNGIVPAAHTERTEFSSITARQRNRQKSQSSMPDNSN